MGAEAASGRINGSNEKGGLEKRSLREGFCENGRQWTLNVSEQNACEKGGAVGAGHQRLSNHQLRSELECEKLKGINHRVRRRDDVV